MEEDVFDKLCAAISDQMGEDRFRPEAYLSLKDNGKKKTLPPIAGEIKVAFCLRLLAGGSYLDLMPLLSVSSTHIHDVFEQFLD